MKYKDKYYKMRYIKAIYIGLIGMLLAGCQADQWESIEGGFLITLSDEVTVTTKSTPAELGEPTTDKFKLKIVNEATNNAAYDGAYKSGTIPAAAGTYTVTATFGDNPVLALDDPYYKGEKTSVVVKDGETTSVNISCSVANALATIFYADTAKFDEMYSSYGVEVKVNNYNYNYSVTIGDGTKKSAYYQAGSKPTFTFKGVLKGNNKEVSKVLENDLLSSASTFEAGQHCKLTLSMEATASGLVPTISKVEASTVTINETIPMEWLPKPKVEAEGFEGNKLSFVETENKTASIKLVTATALQDLKLKFNFEDEQFISSLPKEEYVLSNTGDKQAVETALGITLPEIGTTDANLDLSPLLAKLQTNAGVPTNNSIEIDAKANNRWSSEDQEANRTYTLVCNKPEFSVAVQPGNVWSKEFTVDELEVTAGNSELIKQKLKYQYKNQAASDEDWQDITDLKVHFTEHPQNKNFQVRAVYRDVIASEVVDVVLETPTQLPNSGMEEWTNDNYKNDYYSFNPWREKDENIHWDTSNLFTTRHRNNGEVFWIPTIANYNGFHSVSYVPGRDGLAAELRNTANGRGNVTWEQKDYNKVAGELFIGTAKVTMGTNPGAGDRDGSKDTYEREKNATFTNRPTALKFWYKYAPYNSDTWSAHIELLDVAKNIIIQQDLTSSEAKNDWTEATVSLDYDEGTVYKKCKYIYVIFRSTVNSGANMPYREITQTFYVDGQVKTFSPAYVGSVLTIDDISLVYDK